jgi:autotransporter-associated beta strand protein
MTLSGVNTYTGATTVDGGTLAVNGSIVSSSGVTVNAGGALGGTGGVGNTTIASGGALAPGNSIGTLTVSGNLAFTTGSFYTVEVSPSAADRTNVTGIATLTGANVQAVALMPARFRAQTYTILNASGGFGGTEFAGLDVTNSFRPGARNPHQIYDANNVYHVLDPGEIILPSGTNGNQASVAGGINRAVLGGATPPAGFDTLLNMEGAPLKNALTQISGETATGAQQSTFNAMTMFMGQMTDPFIDGRGDMGASIQGVSSYAADGAARRAAVARDAFAAIPPAVPTSFEQRWNVWAAGFGGSQTSSGNTALGSNGATSRLFGAAAGADYWFSRHTLAGFALAGGGTNFSIVNGGTGRSDLFQAGAFVRHHNGPAYLSAALAYGWQDITTDRTVTIAGIDRLQARFNASTFAGRIEGGYRFATPWMGVTPYAAGQATAFQLPAYAESVLSGANTFALSHGAKTVTATRSELGLRTDRSWAVNDAILTLRGRAAWAHDFNPDRAVAATFQALPGASFVVNGAAQARDAALTTASAEVKWRNGFAVGATFEGEFSGVSRSYAGKGIVRYVW